MSVTIVTDSTATIPATLVEHHQIRVVPMHVEVGGESYLDGEIPLEELASRLDEGVKTSAPSPGEFASALEDAGEDGAVVLTVASRLSGTYQSAVNAARALGVEGIRVVDTGTAAGGQGLVVLAAAEAATGGASLDAVVKRASEVASQVHLVAAVEHLGYLVRGGRMPASVARAGEALGLRVLFELRQARVHPVRPRLSASGARDQIMAHWRRSRPRTSTTTLHAAVLHAMRADAAEELVATLSAEEPGADTFVGSFGPVMVAHTGPGVLGVAWWWEGN